MKLSYALVLSTFVTVALTTVFISGAQESSFKPKTGSEAVPGEVMVKYRGAGFGQVASTASRDRVLKAFDATVVANIPSFGMQRLISFRLVKLFQAILRQTIQDGAISGAYGRSISRRHGSDLREVGRSS